MPHPAPQELLARARVSLGSFQLRDESPEDSASLPEPGVPAAEIVRDLQAAQLAASGEGLGGDEILTE